MYYLVLDLETYPDGVPWKPPEDNPDKFPPIPVHRIVSIGYMLVERSAEYDRCLEIGVFGETEREDGKILGLLDMLEDTGATVVTWNGRHFDIPVLVARCAYHGYPCSYFFERDFDYRFTDDGHLDLADALSRYGAAPRTSLDLWSKTIGLPGKMDVAGDDVKGLVEKGEFALIDAYCKTDVIQTAFVWLRYLHLRGIISDTTHDMMVHSIRSKTMDLRHVSVERLMKSIDMERLLIGDYQDTQAAFEKQGSAASKDEDEDPEIPF